MSSASNMCCTRRRSVGRGGARRLRPVLFLRRHQSRAGARADTARRDRCASGERDRSRRASAARCGSRPIRAATSCSMPAINDRPATFMADTGATLVVLTYEDAVAARALAAQSRFLGLRADRQWRLARGAGHARPRARRRHHRPRRPALVAERGALATNLLGMSFLGRLKSFQMQGSELVLMQ